MSNIRLQVKGSYGTKVGRGEGEGRERGGRGEGEGRERGGRGEGVKKDMKFCMLFVVC